MALASGWAIQTPLMPNQEGRSHRKGIKKRISRPTSRTMAAFPCPRPMNMLIHIRLGAAVISIRKLMRRAVAVSLRSSMSSEKSVAMAGAKASTIRKQTMAIAKEIFTAIATASISLTGRFAPSLKATIGIRP